MNFNNNITYWGDNKGIKILKIHGSCNFIKTGIQGKGNFIMGKGLVEGPLEIIHPYEVEKRMNDCPLPSAMSLYARGKKVIIAPQQINQIIKEFEECVNKSKVIVIIGVRPNPDDHHIWDPLITTSAKLLLIGNESDCKEWLSKYRKNKDDKWVSNRFNIGFNEICGFLDNLLGGQGLRTRMRCLLKTITTYNFSFN